MFDLFRSRDKVVRYTLTGLLGLVALSMVTYLIPSTGDSSGGTGDRSVVATVGKQELSSQDVSKVIQNAMQNRQMPRELAAIYVPQMIQQMITDRAMAYEADRLGIRVSSDETENAIMDSLPPQIIKDGKVDAATLNAVLQQQGITMNSLKDDTARQLAINRLREIVTQGVVVSPREIADEYHRKNDRVKVQYALLSPMKYQDQAEPTDAELQTYYNAHKAMFQTPEKRSVSVVIIDPAKVNASLPAPSDDVLRKEYNANIDKYKTPERVQARHILIKADASNDASAKAKAQDLLKQIKAGGDFAKLAKDNSQDPGSAAMGGELGFIVKGQTVPEFEKAAFTLQPGQTSDLVKTTYGYHIIQVEKHEQAHVQSFDEVKGQLFAAYQTRVGQDQMQNLADKAVAELHKDPANPQKAADAVGGTLVHADNLQAGDPIPGVGVSKELNDAIAPLRKGEITAGPVVLQGNRVAIADVTDYQPAHQASFDEAKAEVRAKAREEKVQNILTQKATELMSKTQSMNGDLEKAAKEMGIEVKTSDDVNRSGAIEGVGSASSLADAFTKPDGSLLGPISVPGGRVIAKVVSKTPADLAQLPSQSAQLRQDLKQQKTRDRQTLFEDGLKRRLQDEGKLKIHQDVIARLIQNYSQQGS